jgi:aryl-alcohol dehydrogenase-like predicted oxidoreductase
VAAVNIIIGSSAGDTSRLTIGDAAPTSPMATPLEGTRFTFGNGGARYKARYWHEQEFATVEALRGMAGEAGMSLVTLAVAWVMSNPTITAPIVGASRPEQLVDSLAAAELDKLPADLKGKLDDLTHGWRSVDADR